MKRTKVIRHVLALLVGHPVLLTGLCLASLSATILEVLGLGLVFVLLGTGTQIGVLDWIPVAEPILSQLIAQPLTVRARWAAILMVVLIGTRSFFQYTVQVISFRLQRQMEIELQARVFEQLHEVRLDYIQREQGGGLMTIATLYTRRTDQMILSLANGLSNSIIITIYVIMALYISWPLTVLVKWIGVCSTIRASCRKERSSRSLK